MRLKKLIRLLDKAEKDKEHMTHNEELYKEYLPLFYETEKRVNELLIKYLKEAIRIKIGIVNNEIK